MSSELRNLIQELAEEMVPEELINLEKRHAKETALILSSDLALNMLGNIASRWLINMAKKTENIMAKNLLNEGVYIEKILKSAQFLSSEDITC